MDLFFRLLVVILSAFRTRNGEDVFDGARLTLKIGRRDRGWDGRILNSRIASFSDLAVANFFVKTKVSAALRKNGWMPIIVGSNFVKVEDFNDERQVTIRTYVAGWREHHVCMRSEWMIEDETVMVYDQLARILAAKGRKITGEQILETIGVKSEYRPLPTGIALVLDRYTEQKLQMRKQ